MTRMWQMRRGDTALWVLTKMAMLFFIAALAGILLVFGGYEKTGLCNEEARGISNRIANGLTQLFNSPVEDERRVIQLEPSLSLGDSSRSRYVMEISRRTLSGGDFNAMVIKVTSEADPRCSAGVQVTYDKQLDSDPSQKRFFLVPAAEVAGHPGTRYLNPPNERLFLRPAPLKLEFGSRTTFVTLLKCTEKKKSLKTFYWLQDCTQKDSNSCINLLTPDSVAGAGIPGALCGFVS